MGKHIKSFASQTEFEENKSSLSTPWVVFVKKTDNVTNEGKVMYKVMKVLDCLEMGYFTLSNNVVTLSSLPSSYNLKSIHDFGKVFFGDNSISGETITTPYVFKDTSKLTIEQKEQMISILSDYDLERGLGEIYLNDINLPDTDVEIKRLGRDGSYHYDAHSDLMSGSVFNKVTIINKRGNISSMNSLFRRANMKELSFIADGGIFKPTDISGMVEFCGDMTKFPNTIDYSSCTNIGYAWECCYALREIPSYHSVTNENERLSVEQNTIGSLYGFSYADQTFNQCVNLEKIGPVMDCRKLQPIESNGGMPYLMFNNCNKLADVRLKNLGNGNWNFSNGIYSMNADSIKYAIENLTYQPTLSWANIEPTKVTNVKVGFNNTSTKLMFLWPTFTSHIMDFYSPKAKYFKVTVPSGYTMDIYGYDSNLKYVDDALTIVGNGQENVVSFTKSTATYPYITLKKSDGSSLTPNSIANLTITIQYSTDGATYSGNAVPSNSHSISFSGRYADKITDKSIISSSLIENANNKGWKIYTDGIEVTPSGNTLVVNYRFSFADWELNEDLVRDGDVEVSQTSVTIKKFRPNMWIIRSSDALNSTNLSAAFKKIYMQIKGIGEHTSTLFNTSYLSNGAVGGDGGTTGSIRGVGILPFSLHSTPTTYYAPELPFSAYIWDSATKTDGSTVQVASELTAWRGDWGAGYNGYGYASNQGKKLVYPDITTFPTPYNNYKLAIGLYTGNVHTFDRWWADNATLRNYLTKETPFKATINGRRASSSTDKSKMLGTQERFTNVKFKFSNMQPNDFITWSHTTSQIKDADGNVITQISQDGIYTVTNSGVDGGFILYGDTSLTGTTPVTIEILDNPSYIDSEGYIDISNNPIVIELIYDSIV